MTERLQPDEKGKASVTLGEVVRSTARNYPDARFHPQIIDATSHYTIAGIDPSPFHFWPTADGIGTKTELAERLYETSIRNSTPTPEVFESLAFDTLAMVDGDEARFGRYMVGVANIIDLNTAEDKGVIHALATGLKAACDEGQFALLNGETAELGYRTSGYGKTRLNWNAVGISVFNPDKLLLGKKLAPGQPVVAFREDSIRSNGLTKARQILETDYLLRHGHTDKETYMRQRFADHGVVFDKQTMKDVLTDVFGHDTIEQVHTPWHVTHPDITRQLLMPSRLYGPLMYEAQGRIDRPPNVDMIAASHITGGGIPEKAKRMVESHGLGIALDKVFPDPQAVTSLLALAKSLPDHAQQKIGINGRIASEQWNRGIGFLVVTADKKEAEKLLSIAERTNYEAAIAGEVISKPQIQFDRQTWQYA